MGAKAAQRYKYLQKDGKVATLLAMTIKKIFSLWHIFSPHNGIFRIMGENFPQNGYGFSSNIPKFVEIWFFENNNTKT